MNTPSQHTEHRAQYHGDAARISASRSFAENYVGSGRLRGQVALVTGGENGIGRAVAIALAKEGADVAIAYFERHDDAQATVAAVERCGQRCIAMAGDLAEEDVSRGAVAHTINQFGRLDVLINNAAEQHPQTDPTAINAEQLQRTFATNVFVMFYCVNAALPQLRRGARIVNTTSVAAYRGDPHLLDFAASKGAVVSYTRSLALALADRGIRVNAVAPRMAPVLPLATHERYRAAPGPEPDEVAPCYVFLATEASTCMTGQVLHPNGEIVDS